MQDFTHYNAKLTFADKYVFNICGLSWDDLPDINSLHNCDTKEDIMDACLERLHDSGFPAESMPNEY